MHAAVARNFEQFVHEIIVATGYDIQSLLKQGHLLASRALRNNDDQSCVDVELGIFSQEIFAIVGNDDVVVRYGEADQIPVLPTGLPKMGDVIGLIPLRFGDRDQRTAQAFIDQEALVQCPLADSSEERHSAP